MAGVVLAQWEDGEAHGGEGAFEDFHAFVDGLLVEDFGDVHHIGFAGEQHSQAGQVFGGGGDAEAPEFGVDAPVVVGDGFVFGELFEFAAGELVGAGAGGAALKHSVALGFVLRRAADGGARHDEDVEPPGGYVHLGLGQVHPEGVVVDDRHIAGVDHFGHRVGAHKALEGGFAAGERVGHLLVDGEDYVFDGEFAVSEVELDALLEAEGVFAGVGADVPFFGELRQDVGDAGGGGDGGQVFPHWSEGEMAAAGGEPGVEGVLGKGSDGQVEHHVAFGHSGHCGGFGSGGGGGDGGSSCGGRGRGGGIGRRGGGTAAGPEGGQDGQQRQGSNDAWQTGHSGNGHISHLLPAAGEFSGRRGRRPGCDTEGKYHWRFVMSIIGNCDNGLAQASFASGKLA